MSLVSMEKLVGLLKRRGFVYPGSEIYGGLANSWDYGPLGAELKKNIKDRWWNTFVRQRGDVVGLDSAVIMNRQIWEASGHLDVFSDPLIECKICHKRFRADQLPGITVEEVPQGKKEIKNGIEVEDRSSVIKINKDAKCPECNTVGLKAFGDSGISNFNLMLKTYLGTTDETANETFLRPETAQGMFVNFKNIAQTSRKKVPFGIAQIGKAFRNEITPGNFIFRTREFEQMEIEYFIAPPKTDEEWNKYFEEWRGLMIEWMKDLGIDTDNQVHELEVPEEERAHYSKRTVDFEYKFPFGQKELYGLAYRGDFDLKNHMEASGEDLRVEDEEGKKYLPHVIEPTWGVDRTVLAALVSAYDEEKVGGEGGEGEETRTVLRFPKWLAPVKVAILPLSKKEELSAVAKEIYKELLGVGIVAEYDETQSIGKRYRRQDEIGTPYCVTVDFDSLEDKKVTVRERDSMKQERVEIKELVGYLRKNL